METRLALAACIVLGCALCGRAMADATRRRAKALKALAEGRDETAEQIKKYISMNGGNRSAIAFGEVDPLGYVHPDQFTQHHTFGNVRERKFGDIWTDVSASPILAGLKDRKPLLKGRCAKCKFLDNCNGNFRTRAEAVTGDFWESDPSCYLTDEEIGIK